MCLSFDALGQQEVRDSITEPTARIFPDKGKANLPVALPDSVLTDSIPTTLMSTDSLWTDSLATDLDILPQLPDSLQRSSTGQQGQPRQPKISDDEPDQPIDYGSADSSYLDLKENQIHLFGEAYVKYGKYNLDAGYIIFDFDDNEASAFDTLPSGLKAGSPSFDDGTSSFLASGLRFNFKSSKGIIYDAVTSEGEFTVLGSKTKFISADADTLYGNDQIYNRNAVITTCTNPTPHFGIRTRKLKLIPNKLAVAGLSNLELGGIPTPLMLPFGFYPLVDGLSSGIIFPARFDSNPNLGLGILGVGYYFPISDYMDLTVTGDIYTRGTHRLTLRSNFKKRYKYSGNAELRYSNNIVENPANLSKTSNRAFSINITRNQDPKAHPYRTVSGSVNISTGDFNRVNFNNFDAVTTQTYRSNFNYRNTLPGTPFALAAGLSHSQDTRTRKMDITLPDAKLTMTTIYPFKKKIPGSTEAWYEKINVGGSSSFRTFVSATDTTLFTQETLDNLETGMYNNATMQSTFRLFKYINVTPSATVDQWLMLRTLNKEFDPVIVIDTVGFEFDQDSVATPITETQFGELTEKYVTGFDALHKANFSLSVQTQRFATRNFSKGWLRGLRHTYKPQISLNYQPGTLDRLETVRFTNDEDVETPFETYNPFQGGSFNPSLNGENLGLNYNITNNIEGKYYSKRDSTVKKFKIFRDIRISGRYNFASETQKWSPLSLAANTQLTKYTQLIFNASYQFYTNEGGAFTTTTIWEDRKRPFEFQNFNLTLNTSLSVNDLLDIFGLGTEEASSSSSTRSSGSQGGASPQRQEQSFGETLGAFKVRHTMAIRGQNQYDGTDTLFFTAHNVVLSGTFDLTPKWSVNVQNIQYDFVRKGFVYPAFTLSRDLHCWNMNFTWAPQRDVYTFFIGVKSSTLSFLKYNYGQQNTDVLSGFGF